MNGPPWPRTEWSPAPSFGAFWAERSPRPRNRAAASAPSCPRGGTSPALRRFLQPIALAANVDGRRVMQQPVQDRCGDDRITEDRSPVPVALVRGQDDAPAFVPCTHQLEENRRSQIVQRQIAHFVDHQNFRRQVQRASGDRNRPSRYARPKSAARSCAVMKYAPSPERIASSASATLKCVFPTPGGPRKITLLASSNESQRTQLAESADHPVMAGNRNRTARRFSQMGNAPTAVCARR